ncbi:MAG TPA: hypothetical protein VKX25_19580 [Bryobacteraceae bacterium]|jgi:hypothetical protein|nr:hypothetical protein [Bryobacteraceae bacterium]
MNLPPVEDRLRRILELTAEESRKCKACGALLFFVRHCNGKLAPYTADGVNHFVNCPSAERFRKGAPHAASASA